MWLDWKSVHTFLFYQRDVLFPSVKNNVRRPYFSLLQLHINTCSKDLSLQFALLLEGNWFWRVCTFSSIYPKRTSESNCVFALGLKKMEAEMFDPFWNTWVKSVPFRKRNGWDVTEKHKMNSVMEKQCREWLMISLNTENERYSVKLSGNMIKTKGNAILGWPVVQFIAEGCFRYKEVWMGSINNLANYWKRSLLRVISITMKL